MTQITRPPVTISLTPEDQGVPRGPGFWKFNNFLLENEEFVTKLKFLILNAKEKYREVTDKRLFWEMIKMEIRIFSIRFAKRKAKEKRDMEFELLRKLQDLNACIDAASEGSPLADEAKKIKIKLDQMAEEKTKGIARTELDGINQEKNVINIFSTFRKEVTTKDT